jgi:HD-GYP domain-containing protein (c-di-GMP phosphodiesterase class II)
MQNNETRQYPLKITISTLFIIITIILGGVLSLQNYSKTSDIILSSADEIYAKIAQELYLDFRLTYSPLLGTLQLLSQSPVTKSTTLDERLQHLKTFRMLLQANPSIYTIGLAFPDRSLFAASLLDSELKRNHFNAPDEAMLLVLSVNTNDKGSQMMTRLFYDEQLNEITRNTTETDLDPFERPWYKQATETPRATKPYLFKELKLVGVAAMVKAEQPGVVVGLNITLDNLSEKISSYQITPRSEVVLINAEGETFAYKNPKDIIIESNDSEIKLANLKQLDSEVLNFLSGKLEPVEQKLDFEFNGERWIGSAKIVAKPGGVDLFALMVSPVDELLADAVAMRSQSLIMTIVIVLLSIPLIWFVARRISRPLHTLSADTEKIARFEFDDVQHEHSFIREVEELDNAMNMMKTTINKFIKLITSLAGEQDLDALLKSITRETQAISKADGALTYLFDETDNMMKPGALFTSDDQSQPTDSLPQLTLEQSQSLLGSEGEFKSRSVHLSQDADSQLKPLLEITNEKVLHLLVIPLTNRNDELIGMLCLFYRENIDISEKGQGAQIAFVEALSGFAAVTLESRQMLNMQEALLNSFIKLIAGAIDAKSPYTGGHCQRVPEITMLLAKAACDSDDPRFRDFALDEKQWQALEIACWLHDCGKVTTPEYVVDKSTKLETIYDRIHEVRMRFEVLKRDATINYWQKLSEGGDEQVLREELDRDLQALDEDYTFIAECNVGGEFMADDKIERLNQIADRSWTRTLDDRVGISWEESNRKNRTEKPALPVEEKLLADKPEHIIERPENERMPDDNPWGFKLDTPEHKYNRGELYNLSIKSGTLSNEERFKINEHMVQTIVMLNKLPYPKHMKAVPDIAGCHHETLDGKGYPKRLTRDETPVTGRMMAIADIFEALTASDRPYKKAKKLSEAIRIMSFMKKDNHIDPDLFELFLTSGTYLEYSKNFLGPDQIDEVDIEQYLAA